MINEGITISQIRDKQLTLAKKENVQNIETNKSDPLFNNQILFKEN